MADKKQEVVDMLFELAELTVIEEGDVQSFRVRAYENAAHGVSASTVDLEPLSVKELEQIENVGKSTAEKIREFLDTGHVTKLDALRAKHPPSVVALLRVPGLGPKALKRLRVELDVQSIDDLRAALAEGRLRELPGFGQKSEEKLAKALERLDAEGGMDRTPIAAALPLASRIAASLRELDGVSDVTICGSIRRFLETIGDVDIVVSADDPAPVMDAVVAHSAVESVLAHGAAKTSVLTKGGLQVDVRVVSADQLGAALVYFTGSKAHNIHLRWRALARGLTLNEYALSEIETGNVVARETESEIYEALGLPWIAPAMREDSGEIEAAEAGTLPPPLGPVTGDFHLHTTVSRDGRATLEEMAASAKERGLAVLAITDHGAGTLSGASAEALLEQRAAVRALQAELGDSLLLLHGVELNITRDGGLDYDAEFRAQFDWCVASIHDNFDLPAEAQTRRVLAAIADPAVKMIGHLSSRMIGHRPPIEIDLDAVFAAASEKGVAIEVNGGLPRLDLPVDWLRRARSYDFPILLSSDAHNTAELANVEFARLNATRAWVPPERVPNVWPAEQLKAWVVGRLEGA